MTIPADLPSPSEQPKRRRATFIVIALLLILWAVVMGYRMEIRAQWWAWRITQVEDTALRNYYAACLAAIGDKSLAALPRLLNDPQAYVRLIGVRALRTCPDPRSLQYLLARLGDSDIEVSDAAALEIALRPGSLEAVPSLRAMLDRPAPAVLASMATLERIGGPQVEEILLDRLKTATDPDIIAQAIDSLGMLHCKAAESAIREHLTDTRRLSRPPAAQRRAEQAIAAISGKLINQGINPSAVATAARTNLTISAVAARALASITQPPTTRPAPTATKPAR